MGKKIFKNLDPSFVNKLSSIVGHKSKIDKNKTKSSTSGTKTFKHSITTSNKPPTPPPLPLPIPKITKKSSIKPKNLTPKLTSNPTIKPTPISIPSPMPIQSQQLIPYQNELCNVNGNTFVKLMREHVKMSQILLEYESNKTDKMVSIFIICFFANLFMYVFFKIIP